MRALAQARVQHFRINLMETSFFIGREKLRPQARRTRFWRWRDRLFILLNNLSLDATEFFRIPPNRVSNSAARWRFRLRVPAFGRSTCFP